MKLHNYNGERDVDYIEVDFPLYVEDAKKLGCDYFSNICKYSDYNKLKNEVLDCINKSKLNLYNILKNDLFKNIKFSFSNKIIEHSFFKYVDFLSEKYNFNIRR